MNLVQIGCVLASASLLLTPRSLPAQAPHDECSTAIVTGIGITAGSTSAATTSPQSPSCTAFMSKDVWYQVVAPCTGTMSVTTCAASGGFANFDTVLAAWNGTVGCCSLKEVACNDDSCPAPAVSSAVTFAVVAGTPYLIQVGGYAGASGSFAIVVSCAPGPFTPPNDHQNNSIALALGKPIPGTNVGATTGAPLVGSCGSMAKDVWYIIDVGQAGGTFNVTTCFPGTTMDTVVSVWDVLFTNEVACNDDGCALPGSVSSTATFIAPPVPAGYNAYLIEVGGFNGATGNFVVRVSRAEALDFSFISSGPGKLGFTIGGGPPNGGSYFAALTLNQGSYPGGWFLGLDIPIAELIGELTGGPPFNGSLSVTGCGGAFTAGPYPGLPTGLTFYGVAVAFPPGSGVATAISNPATGTVP